MKKAMFLMLFLVLSLSSVVYADNIPLEFSRLPHEPENMDPERLLDVEYNYTPAKGVYQDEILDALAVFFANLSGGVTQHSKAILSGTWYLRDGKGERINRVHKWGAGEYFSVGDNETVFWYERGSGVAVIYYSSDGKYYFSPMFFYGITKQMRIYDSQLYFYVLVGDAWILDPIHEGGQYFYVRETSG
jgi:hypothetical protein